MLHIGERKTGFKWIAEVSLCEVSVFMWLHTLAKNSMIHTYGLHGAETLNLASFYQSYQSLQIVNKTFQPNQNSKQNPSVHCLLGLLKKLNKNILWRMRYMGSWY